MIPPQSILSLKAMAASMASGLPMSGHLLAILTDDIVRRGPINTLIADHPEADAPLFCLRALAGVRLLLLTGQAPQFAAHLECFSADTGNPGYDQRTRHLFYETLLGHPEEILAAMDRPVQQHVPSRAASLLRGLGMVGSPRIRLLELGACAGLNLLLDRYRWFGLDWEWGDSSSPVRLAATGPHPGNLTIVERAGCDLAPRDPADPRDAMILRSFIPPEREIEQLELDDAISLAAGTGVRVDKADANEWLRTQLSRPADRTVYTVVWHSLFSGYLSQTEQAELDDILTAASRRMPVARVSYENPTWTAPPRLQTTLYS